LLFLCPVTVASGAGLLVRKTGTGSYLSFRIRAKQWHSFGTDMPLLSRFVHAQTASCCIEKSATSLYRLSGLERHLTYARYILVNHARKIKTLTTLGSSATQSTA
jgi:hypothetical protein